MITCQPSMSISAVVQAIRDRLEEKRPGFSPASSTASGSKRSASISFSENSDNSSRRIKGRKPEVLELSESDDDDSDRALHRAITTPASSRPVGAPQSYSPFRSPSPMASTRIDEQRLSPPPRLDLSRFAHEAGGPRSSKTPASDSLSRKASSTKKAPAKVPDAPVKSDILRKLKKCILCGEDWAKRSRIGRTKWVRPLAPCFICLRVALTELVRASPGPHFQVLPGPARADLAF
jgi:hypothetical protein